VTCADRSWSIFRYDWLTDRAPTERTVWNEATLIRLLDEVFDETHWMTNDVLSNHRGDLIQDRLGIVLWTLGQQFLR
jgi:hypothetical protein